MMRADNLLAGPRGRRLCLEFAVRWWDPESTAVNDLRQAVSYASHALATNPGTIMTISSFKLGAPTAVPVPTSEIPTVTAADVARLLDSSAIAEPSAAALTSALGMAVGNARYWQDPDGEDALASTPEVRSSLRRFADAIAAAPAAATWATPIDTTEQWEVTFEGTTSVRSGGTTWAHDRLVQWRAEQISEEGAAQRNRPADPAAPWSGTWWSAPVSVATSTTRTVLGFGPHGLWHVEDELGWESATVERIGVPDRARIYEIDSADAWAELCRRYPLEVTASCRHDWYRATGRAGEWVIPDWSLVAHHYDAVHLTVAGYLSAAGVAIAIDDTRASVIAGWDPDKTYWLVDVDPEPGTTQRWRFDRNDDTWVRQDSR